MPTVSVRYIVNDVDAAIAFYRDNLGFTEVMHPAPAFAMLSRGDLRLLLPAPGAGPGGGQAMPDGSPPNQAAGTGSRSRFPTWQPRSADCRTRACDSGTRSSPAWAASRSWPRTHQATQWSCSSRSCPKRGCRSRPERPTSLAMTSPPASGSPHPHPARREYEVKPIGWVESPLADLAQAPNQGGEGAPPAWLVVDPHLAEGTRDLRAGEHIIVLTWLDRARRDELSTVPGDNPDSSPLVLDEPLSALDQPTREDMRSLLQQLLADWRYPPRTSPTTGTKHSASATTWPGSSAASCAKPGPRQPSRPTRPTPTSPGYWAGQNLGTAPQSTARSASARSSSPVRRTCAGRCRSSTGPKTSNSARRPPASRPAPASPRRSNGSFTPGRSPASA